MFIANVQNIRFYLTLVSLNLGSLCAGLIMGWTLPSKSLLMAKTSRMHLTEEHVSWLDPLIYFGAGIGVLVPISLADTYGRRKTFMIAGIINYVSWILIATAYSIRLLYFGVFTGGCGTGIIVTTTSIYVGEICPPKIRGTIGTLTSLFSYIAVFLMSCSAPFVSPHTLVWCLTAIPLMFLTSIVLWMVESPHFLLRRGRVLDAKRNLMALRGKTDMCQIEEEYKSMEEFFNSEFATTTKLCTISQLILGSENIKKPFIFTFPVLFTSQMVGGHAMDDYMQNIIDAKIPIYGNVVVNVVGIISVGVCSYTIEKIGRKPLLMGSIYGTATCCLILAIYVFLKEETNEIDSLSVTVVLIYHLAYFFGLVPVLPVLASEILPNKMKTVAAGLITALFYIIAICMERLYICLTVNFGASTAFANFAILGSLGLPLVNWSVPETKGKSLQEIENEMRSECSIGLMI